MQSGFSRLTLLYGGLLGASGVALSAYGAHVGGDNLKTAAQFALFHAPALLALGAFSPSFLRKLAFAAIAIGVVLFCGDLIMRELAGHRLFPYSAPAGGMLMITGWVLTALSAFGGARR